MGYAVLHLEKAKGADGAMSTHIERTVHPKNADRMRTHLNRELVRFPEGVKNRTQAIAHLPAFSFCQFRIYLPLPQIGQ